jgi:hypothetical protein
MDVVVPGGLSGGLRQSFPGAPRLAAGEEYMIFLWTGRSGLTQVIGLSQGLFDVKTDARGELVIYRAASGERMLEPRTGREVEDEAVQMRMRDMSDRIGRALNSAAVAK